MVAFFLKLFPSKPSCNLMGSHLPPSYREENSTASTVARTPKVVKRQARFNNILGFNENEFVLHDFL